MRRKLPALLARPAAVLIAASGLTLVVLAASQGLRTVYVTDASGSTVAFVSHEKDNDKLLQKAGIQISEGDICYYTAYPNQIENISLQNTFSFVLQADGESHTAKMSGGNVQDALDKAGITLGEHDYTEPSLNAPVTENTPIKVHRVSYQDTVTTESIPFETEYQYTSLFYRNKRRQVTVLECNEGTN